jgi:hypothetical protein
MTDMVPLTRRHSRLETKITLLFGSKLLIASSLSNTEQPRLRHDSPLSRPKRTLRLVLIAKRK